VSADAIIPLVHHSPDPQRLGLAPIVLFAYMRADHLQRCVESLLANPGAAASDVVFYCDGPRHPHHRPMVDAVRAYVDGLSGFHSIRRVYRDENIGLRRSVMAGVAEVLAGHGRAIVLEEDLVLSPHFLEYMNDGLDRYENVARVASIHGYVYPVDRPLPETFFLKGADCWGWATWSRAWAQFEPDGTRLLAELKARGLTREFDFDGQFPYTSMLQDQIAGRNSSWAVLWHASCFLKDLLTLYPGRSLVQNIGNDSSGTHCGTNDGFSGELARSRVACADIAVEPSISARDAFVAFFRSQRSWQSRILDSVKRVMTQHA
jgi:hypothetical protein